MRGAGFTLAAGAAHELGHGLVGSALGRDVTSLEITASFWSPDQISSGFTHVGGNFAGERGGMGKLSMSDVEIDAVFIAAGYVAQKRFHRECEDATERAAEWSADQGSGGDQDIHRRMMVDAERAGLETVTLGWARQRAEVEVERRWERLLELVPTLEQHRRMKGRVTR